MQDKWTLEDFLFDKFLNEHRYDKALLKALHKYKFLIDIAILDTCNELDNANGFDITFSLQYKDMKHELQLFELQLLVANDTTYRVAHDNAAICSRYGDMPSYSKFIALLGHNDHNLIALLVCWLKYMSKNCHALFDESIEHIKRLAIVNVQG